MLHLFLDKKPWFRAKNRGYGTGLPIAWQGWVFMALHIALIAGLSMALRNQPVAMTIVVVLAALAPMPIYQARTEGEAEERLSSAVRMIQTSGRGDDIVLAVLDGDGWGLLRALLAGTATFAFYLVLGLTRAGAMGFGDIKLAGLLGLALGWVGWSAVVVGVFAGFVIGGIIAVALLAARRVSRGGGIPFGPAMLAGAWLGLVAGPALWNGYLGLMGLA